MCINGNKFVAQCTCGAVKMEVQIERGKIGFEWTLSAGVVAKARQMNLDEEKCCGCSGHPCEFGGYSDESHLGSLLATA
jgi:hypothetical protein